MDEQGWRVVPAMCVMHVKRGAGGRARGNEINPIPLVS